MSYLIYQNSKKICCYKQDIYGFVIKNFSICPFVYEPKRRGSYALHCGNLSLNELLNHRGGEEKAVLDLTKDHVVKSGCPSVRPSSILFQAVSF